MSTIETAGALRPGTTDTPLDQRSRVNTLAEINAIELPYLGLIVYCVETDRYYRVTALKSAQIGALTVADAAVDTYEELPITPSELQGLIVTQVTSNPTILTFLEELIAARIAESDGGSGAEDPDDTGGSTDLPTYPEGVASNRVIVTLPDERYFSSSPSSYSSSDYEWSDSDVMTIEVSSGSVSQAYAWDGGQVRYNSFPMLCAGQRCGIELSGATAGTLTIRFISHGSTVKTTVVNYTGYHVPKYFTRPAGDGSWQLKIGGSTVGAEYWSGSAWVDFPAEGIGPDLAGKYIRPKTEPSAPVLACWSNGGVDGIPFLYMT